MGDTMIIENLVKFTSDVARFNMSKVYHNVE